MGTIVSKVKLKDGTVRDFADNYSRSAINIIEAAIGQIAPELEMTVHVVDDATDMPAPAASLEDKVYIYVGSTTQNYTQNTIYVCKETATAGTYAWSEIVASKDEVINIVNNIVEENKIQVTTMPVASSAVVGKVVQYIGTTNANYTNGYFYKCVEQEATAKYTAPNGNTYKHKVIGASYDLSQRYAIYSDYKMCFVDDSRDYQDINGTRYYHLIVNDKNRTDYCYDLRSLSGSYTGTRVEIYPERVPSSYWGYDNDHFIFKNDTTTQPSSSGTIFCVISDNEGIPVVSSTAAASAYFAAPDLVYIWQRIDTQPTPVIPEQVQADWNQDDNTQKDYIKNKPDIENIQVEILPNASAAEVGSIYQYIGETTSSYTNGYFYKCVGAAPAATYTAPDGNKYIYKYPYSTGSYNTRYGYVYSNKKICTCDAHPYETTNRKLLGLGVDVSDQYSLCDMNTQQQTAICNLTKRYPSDSGYSLVADNEYYVWDTNGNLVTYNNALYNYNVTLDVPNFETEEEAYAYLLAPDLVYSWERIDIQPAPAEYDDKELKERIGNLQTALGAKILYTNYLYNKTNKEKIIIDKEFVSSSSTTTVIGYYDPLLNEIYIEEVDSGSVIPIFGTIGTILDGDDLFTTKLSKNLPNGSYSASSIINSRFTILVKGSTISDPTTETTIATLNNESAYPRSNTFTITDDYDYTWLEVVLNAGNEFHDFGIVLSITKDPEESIMETMSRPKVPRSNAVFTDHTYAAYDETNVPEGITINDGSFIFEDVGVAQPGDNPYLPSPLPAPTYANIKIKGWDDLVNSIDVKVRGTVNDTSINAGVTSEIATFEFYNGNESEEQDVALEGVLNFSVAIVDHSNPVSIIFSVYDNLTQVGSYTVGIDTDGYKYINFKYTVSDNIGVGNKLYKIKMTPINCNIT